MTKLRALRNYGRCWKKGDEFEIYFDCEGDICITCNSPTRSSSHYIIAPDGNYARTLDDCRLDFEVIEKVGAPPLSPHLQPNIPGSAWPAEDDCGDIG